MSVPYDTYALRASNCTRAEVERRPFALLPKNFNKLLLRIHCSAGPSDVIIIFDSEYQNPYALDGTQLLCHEKMA